MSSWKPALLLTVISGAAIFAAFPDYVSLQSAPSPEEFRGVLGDDDTRATLAAAADLVFAAGYAWLGVALYCLVSGGVPRLIGSVAIVGAAIADEVENALVIRNVGRGLDLDQGAIDPMLLAGNVKWGLLVLAVVLLLALAGQRRLDARRA